MCGIAGIYSFGASASVDRRQLLAMSDHMVRRGPDGAGQWYSSDGRVGLAHRRLAIIDLSDRAAQPMLSADGELAVTFNGEIYNYRELRAELEREGAVFRTTSDTEVLLHMYARHGEAMLGRLRGMFAFALWDGRAQRMLLARDPYGIKPLYYAVEGGVLKLASQVLALTAGGVSKQRDAAGQVGFYLWGSVPEPFTMYRAIRSLPAGAFAWVDERGVSETKPFFSVAQVWARDAEDVAYAPEQVVAQAHRALRDSVRHHMIADVPVSAFLSGGIDSGALCALMGEHAGQGVHGVTLRFAEFAGGLNDEAPLAREIARAYGFEHHIRDVGQAEFMADLPHIFAAMDQPTIDGMNTWFVSKAVAELGLKVAISGLGGDELFGGYSSFADVPRFMKAGKVPSVVPGLGKAVRRVAAPLLSRFPAVHPKLAGLAEYGGTLGGAYQLKRGLFMPWELSELLPNDVVAEGTERLLLAGREEEALLERAASDFGRVAALEATRYMRNQLLRDTDWASMAHSLEVRVPLVDSVLLQQVAPLVAQASDQALKKSLLATAPARPMPSTVLQHPKTGFSTPVDRWLGDSAELSSWRRLAVLRRKNCPWARRLAYAVGDRLGIHG